MRAVEQASPRWLVWSASFVGFGFLTKMLQALLVVPAFALAYLVAAPTPLRRRILHLLAAGAAMLVSAGWWIAIVELVPASARPYIGGSQNNSILSSPSATTGSAGSPATRPAPSAVAAARPAACGEPPG